MALAMAGLLAGCASTSDQSSVAQNQLSGFQKGITTEQQVIADLGNPNSTGTTYDGNRVDIYRIDETSTHGGGSGDVKVVDLITLLEHETHAVSSTTTTTTTQKTVTFTFDKSGMLLGYAVDEPD